MNMMKLPSQDTSMDSDSVLEGDDLDFASLLEEELETDNQIEIPAQVIPHKQDLQVKTQTAEILPIPVDNQIRLIELLPYITPRINKAQVTKICYHYSRMKNNEINMSDFTIEFRRIVGVGLIREAFILRARGQRGDIRVVPSQSQNCSSSIQNNQIQSSQFRGQREDVRVVPSRSQNCSSRVQNTQIQLSEFRGKREDVRVVPSQHQNCSSPIQNNQVELSELLKLILLRVDENKRMQLQGLYSKFKNRMIGREDLIRFLGVIVGKELILNAIQKLQESRFRQVQVQKQGGMVQTLPKISSNMGNRNCCKIDSRKDASPSVTTSSVPVTRPSEQWNFLRTMPKPNTPSLGQKKRMRVDAPPTSLPNKMQKVDMEQKVPKKDSHKKQGMEVETRQNVTKTREKASNKQEAREIKETPSNVEAMLKWQHMAAERRKPDGLMVANQTCPAVTDHPTMAESSECIPARESQVPPTTGTQSDVERETVIESVLKVGEPSCASKADNIPEPCCPPQQPEEEKEESEQLFQTLFDHRREHLPEYSEDVCYLDNLDFLKELASCV